MSADTNLTSETRQPVNIQIDALVLLDHTVKARASANGRFSGFTEHPASAMGYWRQCDALDWLIAHGFAEHRSFRINITEAGRAWVAEQETRDDEHS